jgi:hypothetical protein
MSAEPHYHGNVPARRHRYSSKYIYYNNKIDRFSGHIRLLTPIELAAHPGSLGLRRRGAHAWKTGLMVVECLSRILTSACPLVLQV